MRFGFHLTSIFHKALQTMRRITETARSQVSPAQQRRLGGAQSCPGGSDRVSGPLQADSEVG